MKPILYVIVLFSFLAGCESTSQQSTPPPSVASLLNNEHFQQVELKDPELFTLPAEEQKRFLNYFTRHQGDYLRDDQVLYQYLENKLSNFNYFSATLNAQQALQNEQGNCISLAILTHAYAQLVGLKTGFQAVSSEPVYSKQNNIVYVSGHFRTKVYAPLSEEDNYLVPPGTVIDYFPARGSFYSGRAELKDLISRYYSNLASDALIANQFDLSYSYILKANEYTPNSAALYNLAAVLHRQSGDLAGAKHIYQTAMQHGFKDTNLLHNYAVLAEQLNDQILAEQLNSQLAMLRQDPFELLATAINARNNGQFYKAKQQLEEAIALAPYLSEPYIELAIVSYQQGNEQSSKEWLEKAIEIENKDEKLALYHAKLFALKGQH
ncbi:tetratricopeptide repeat protein [Pseudoalteromonas sp. PA2MD11]|uniref:tetratricopeptide repeat protein n=1 Tax=Pseudoalteromonas sp. PA2MD11 TaxID=2785057 RepID=UPI001ADF4A02|nr:hypothetical protein [Pseudoalteromonas sp. PA2MD11]